MNVAPIMPPRFGFAGQALAGLAAVGGRALADVAPSGGRHVYILFAAALPWRDLRDLCRAMALRFPSIDPAPMANLRRPDQPGPARDTRAAAGGSCLRP